MKLRFVSGLSPLSLNQPMSSFYAALPAARRCASRTAHAFEDEMKAPFTLHDFDVASVDVCPQPRERFLGLSITHETLQSLRAHLGQTRRRLQVIRRVQRQFALRLHASVHRRTHELIAILQPSALILLELVELCFRQRFLRRGPGIVRCLVRFLKLRLSVVVSASAPEQNRK